MKSIQLTQINFRLLSSCVALLMCWLSLISTSAYAKGGDLGGGGGLTDMKRDFRLDNKLVEQLKQQQELVRARDAWLNTLTDEEFEVVLNKVFKHHIAPQLSEKKLNSSGAQ